MRPGLLEWIILGELGLLLPVGALSLLWWLGSRGRESAASDRPFRVVRAFWRQMLRVPGKPSWIEAPEEAFLDRLPQAGRADLRVPEATLAVQVIANAARDAVGRWEPPTLHILVRCAANDGAANKAVMQVLAAMLGLELRHIEVIRGTFQDEKKVRIRGIRPDELKARLQAVRD